MRVVTVVLGVELLMAAGAAAGDGVPTPAGRRPAWADRKATAAAARPPPSPQPRAPGRAPPPTPPPALRPDGGPGRPPSARRSAVGPGRRLHGRAGGRFGAGRRPRRAAASGVALGGGARGKIDAVRHEHLHGTDVTQLEAAAGDAP